MTATATAVDVVTPKVTAAAAAAEGGATTAVREKHKKMAQELAKSVLENRARSEEQQKEFDAAFKDF